MGILSRHAKVCLVSLTMVSLWFAPPDTGQHGKNSSRAAGGAVPHVVGMLMYQPAAFLAICFDSIEMIVVPFNEFCMKCPHVK